MVAKLKLLLRSQIFQLASRAALFGVFLHWFLLSSSPVAALFFILAASWLYLRPLFNATNLLPSFLVLLASSLWTVNVVENLLIGRILVVFFSLLFFIVLGLKDFVLIKRHYWYALFSFSLFYAAYINFFLIDKSSLFFLKWLLFLAVIFLLWREFLRTLGLDRFNLSAFVITFITGQLLWIASWLPIGYLALSNLLILCTLFTADLLLNYFRGKLHRRLLIKDSVAFLVMLLVVFLTSSWS